MPVDASILLQGKTPQIQSPLDRLSRLTQLQGQQQQVQQNAAEAPLRMQQLQQGVQTGNLDLQQKQQQLKDQQASSAALSEWNGKDYNDLLPLVAKHGASAQAVLGLRKSILDQQTQIATAAKDNGEAALSTINATMKKNDLITGALSPLLDPTKVPDDQLSQTLSQTVQGLQQQGALDPQHAAAAQQLVQSGNPNAIRQGIDQFSKTLTAQSQITDKALKTAQADKATADAAKSRGAVDPTSPLYAPTPAAVALGTAPGAAQIQAGEANLAGKKAGAEAAARQPYEMSLARQRQALSQGDPKAAAALLVNGDATLSELKARGATPEFIANTLSAAHELSGGKYNAQSADAQFQVAKSPTNVAFFGSAKSLIDKGGTLDQLATAAKDIPGGLIPAFNSIADWEKAASGSGPIAKYASIALGAADDYAKVMGSGTGSDASRKQALDLFGAKMSPQQRAGSISGVRGAVNSQGVSRIGDNPVLDRMYGSSFQKPNQQASPSAPPAGATHVAPGSDGKNHYTNDKGQDLGVAP